MQVSKLTWSWATPVLGQCLLADGQPQKTCHFRLGHAGSALGMPWRPQEWPWKTVEMRQEQKEGEGEGYTHALWSKELWAWLLPQRPWPVSFLSGAGNRKQSTGNESDAMVRTG